MADTVGLDNVERVAVNREDEVCVLGKRSVYTRPGNSTWLTQEIDTVMAPG